ncbi:hypothetical protein MLD38_004318 [Melastoma candidum]|uniref:Uncharacterized protein n=1 Tax=Melastoma candidum TaxID=119954 RepID=A0ACB9S511_9MYRT|nr:hypothetical protein MLD38_004318 [Melastoma candidum]
MPLTSPTSLQNCHSRGKMSLILSTDVKQRLKWTPELHLRFVEAIAQLGGADKATPKSLMRVMHVPGLTLYHLKSHLQKYRLGKSPQSDHSCNGAGQRGSDLVVRSSKANPDVSGDCNEVRSAEEPVSFEYPNEARERHLPMTHVQGLQIAQAFRLQLEVQKQLHEQMEVQKHLQLRIEAQGKYLQSVLRKAWETLAGYGDSSQILEDARAELSHLVSVVDSGYRSPTLSDVTELGNTSSPKSFRVMELLKGVPSVECSLTSSESSGRKEELRETSYSQSSDGKRPAAAHDVGEHKRRKREFPPQIDLNCRYTNDYNSDATA